MKQDNTPRDYTQLMSEGMWEKAGDDMCSPEEVISFLNGGGAFRSFGDGLIWVITQKKPGLTGCTPKEIAKSILSILSDKEIKFNRNTLDSWLTSRKATTAEKISSACRLPLILQIQKPLIYFRKCILIAALTRDAKKNLSTTTACLITRTTNMHRLSLIRLTTTNALSVLMNFSLPNSL